MVKLLKQVRYLCTSKNTKGQRVDYKGTTNATRSTTFKQKYQKPDQTKDNIFLKPDDRTYGERVDDRLEGGWIQELNGRKAPVKMVETTNFNRGRYHQESENANRALKEARGAKEMYGERISFPRC